LLKGDQSRLFADLVYLCHFVNFLVKNYCDFRSHALEPESEIEFFVAVAHSIEG